MIIAQHFPGWTLEYIDSLSYQDYQDVLGVLDAQAKVSAERRKNKRRR